MRYHAPENDPLDSFLGRDRVGLINAASFNQGRAPTPNQEIRGREAIILERSHVWQATDLAPWVAKR
jgi:hypothetical protein